MKVLKGILKDSKNYYEKAKADLEFSISKLPKGNIKKRKLGGGIYYYLQYRKDKKVIHKYLGKSKPDEIITKIKKRRSLEKELKKVNESLKLLSKVKK